MTNWRDYLNGASTPTDLTTRENIIKAAVNKIRATNTATGGNLDQKLYEGLAKIFDEWMGLQKREKNILIGFL